MACDELAGILRDQRPLHLLTRTEAYMEKHNHGELEKSVQELAEVENELRSLECRYRLLEELMTQRQVTYHANSDQGRLNQTLEQIFGWQSEETPGRQVPYVAPDKESRVKSTIREDWCEKAKSFVTRLSSKGGVTMDVAVSRSRFYDSSGKTAGVVVILRDVSEGRILDEAPDVTAGARRARKEYGRFFRQHSEGLAIVDYSESWFQMNRHLARIVGFKMRDIRSCSEWHELAPLRQLFYDPVLRRLVLTHGRVMNYETPYVRKDGSRIWLLIHGTLLKGDPKGRQIAAFSVADITLRKRREENAERSSGLLAAYSALLENELAKKTNELELARKNLAERMLNLEKTREAMQALMIQIQEQKKGLQDRLNHNLNLTVYPIIEHLREPTMSAGHAHLLDVLAFNIQHVSTKFGAKILSHQAKLSHREVEICHMIRAGKDSREIATSLGLTYETVIVHRKNIRKKLGLNKKKQNLAGYIRERM